MSMLDMTVQDQPTAPTSANDDENDPARVTAKVDQIIKTIKSDKEHHKNAFKQMRDDMFMAMRGRDKDRSEQSYKANFIGRHVKVKTAALYAKNPKAVARRPERLDFAVWDENPASLMLAFQTVQAAMAAKVQADMMPPEQTAMGTLVPAQPELPPGFEEAQALIADFQKGTAYRQLVDKIGKTLEILFARSLRDQEPVDFKTAAKQLVRRCCTTGVGYVELGFVREHGPRDGLTAQLADAKVRLDHLRRLAEEVVEGEIDGDDAEMAELEASIASLTAEPEIVLREGLTFDFPASTKVIPDKLCRSLVGFIGAEHLTIEYQFTIDRVEEMFPGVDLKTDGYTGYGADGSSDQKDTQIEIPFDNEIGGDSGSTEKKGKDLVCVWKHYDKPSGLVYFVADGYKKWLREPAAPDVFVEKFWPLFALTFNAVESEDDLFPPSDVYLLRDQQNEHNRSRQGMREHREAARPRWGVTKAVLDDEDKNALKNAKPFDVIELNKAPEVKLAEVIESIPVPGVDPNLYGTEQFFGDTQIVVGAQQAQFGGVAKATATESAIAANSTASSDGSSSDDLDSFLTVVARAAGQVLLGEMSEEQVMKIVGPGAVWPALSLSQIASEIFLEVEAGSSGRPNQAVEIDNLSKMMPFLLQMPDIDKTWLAKETLKRMDDRLDLTAAIAAGAPSIVAQNQQAQPGTGDTASDPNAQGQQGGANAPQQPKPESPGSGPEYGSNQV